MVKPREVTLIEVGPRDGLQNEPLFVPSDVKIKFINQLSLSGLQDIEVTSFVSPSAIPQLADNEQVFQSILKQPGVRYSALIPNEKGMQAALKAKVPAIAIFTAASESFNQRNIHCSIAESLARFQPVMALAKESSIPVRAYISCALGCPYEGAIGPQKVLEVAEALLALGVDELSIGDTIGVATPMQTKTLVDALLAIITKDKLALHFHDTYGQAVANIHQALEQGIRRFDTATAGLGGCPYARGATGNVATEDVLYLLHGLGLETGIDIFKIVAAGNALCMALGKKNQSKVATALLGL